MAEITRTRSHSTTLRTAALTVGALTATLLPAVLPGPPAGAAPTDPTTLVVTASSGVRLARGGAPATVRATVTNEGASVAGGVRLRYRLPTGVDPVLTASTPGCAVSGRIVDCPAGNVAPGAASSIDIAVRVTDPSATLGTRPGYFLPPTSADYDPGSGEVLQSTWYHEAGAEGTPLATCWPIDAPSPHTDIAGGDCDGTADSPALDPDEAVVLDAFPEPFNESLVRSWQFETEIVAPASGQYHACGVLIDDGGYLAVEPVGQAFTPGSIRVQTDTYGTATGAPFTLTGGIRYRVLMRVSNRGGAGIDNGDNGGTLAGWTAYGISPVGTPCDTESAAVFGTADSAWVDRTPADVIVVGSSDLVILGMVESAPVDGVRTSAVRVGNQGRDATGATATLVLPPSATLEGRLSGCDGAAGDLTCRMDAVEPLATSDSGRVLSASFRGPTGGAGWKIASTTAVDTNPSNDDGRLQPVT